MNTPPLLLSAALLFWGWQADQLLLAAPIAVALELRRMTSLRWDLQDRDFSRISDLCAVLFAGIVVYQYLSNLAAHTILLILQLLPLSFFPLLLAQAYSTAGRINIQSLFIFMRKSRLRDRRPLHVDLSYPLVLLCVLCAGAANQRTHWYYVCTVLLAAWSLWPLRSRRCSPAAWLLLLALTAAAGYGTQSCLHQLQKAVHTRALHWFLEFMHNDINPYRARTAIGSTGTIRTSGRIMFRVQTHPPQQRPLLLRESSYNIYNTTMWLASHPEFKALRHEVDETTWVLGNDNNASRSLVVSERLHRGRGMLKLPTGAQHITRLPVGLLAMNRYGSCKIEDGPGLLRYRVAYNPRVSIDSPPDKIDLVVPPEEASAIYSFLNSISFKTQNPAAVVKTLSEVFKNKFTYSLRLTRPPPGTTPLADFLHHTHTGHCEYYATAMVLLLRAAGIPARYAAGYLVQEYSPLENQFIVRSSHQHAWALAYINGAWRDVDATPTGVPAARTSLFRGTYDLFSWLFYKFMEWRWSDQEIPLRAYIPWLLIPLIIIFIRNTVLRRRISLKPKTGSPPARIRPMGADSGFYQVEHYMHKRGISRPAGESLSRWSLRVKLVLKNDMLFQQLNDLLALHYRYRFDPAGIPSSEKLQLAADAGRWVQAADKQFRAVK